MLLATALVGGFFVVELVVGIGVGSLALIADAGHVFTDVMALAMGLSALLLARHGATTDARSFGWHRAEVFTAIVNAVLLLGVTAFVVVEAVRRIGAGSHPPGVALIVVALCGLAVNVAVMCVLRAGAAGSIAMRGAYLEVLADAVGSVGVLVAGVVMLTTGWGYADVIVAIGIAVWVVPRALRLAVDALRILNQQAPQQVDIDALRRELGDIEAVEDVHDLHVWSLTTGMDVATVHLVSHDRDADVLDAAQRVLSRHGLEHATVQVDSATQEYQCREHLRW